MIHIPLFDFLGTQMPELLLKLWQQIYMVGFSTLVAIVLGIPLGIIAHRHKSFGKIIISIANILQTIPSLALLAFLIPFLGIGVLPAITALILYALLPIIRNTLQGLEGVSPTLLEAAKGIGFTPMQQLWQVEFPMAMPAILTGIRLSTVIGVGIATLAAFIGAGGLGDFINRGLMTNNTQLILLGAIPAALLALFMDFSLGWIEKRFRQRSEKMSHHKKHRKLFLSTVVLFICMGLIFFFFHARTQRSNTIIIGSKNFTESIILSEMMAKMIETHTNLKVERKFDLGGTKICQEAMLKGAIDLYPDYTGTAYTMVLNKNYVQGISPQDIFTLVKNEYLKKFNILWLSPFGFNNSQSLAVKKSFSQHYHVKNISDLTSVEKILIFAIPAEARQRFDGIPGLKKIYGLDFPEIREMNMGLIYEALLSDKVNVALVFTTDGQIPAYSLVVLKDDKHLYLPYDAAPLIREKTLAKHPEIQKALAPLLGSLDDKTMQQLNAKAQLSKIPAEIVADDYLKEKGFL